jgi:hypothetical protein
VNFLKFALEYQTQGSIVIATLSGVESDVFLVDAPNLLAFERGASFHYHGVHAKKSPVTIPIPSTGEWTAVVVPGVGGAVEASVRVVPLQ